MELGNENESNNPDAVPDVVMAPELAELVDLASLRSQIDAREAELLADPTVGAYCLADFGHRTPQWLAASTHIPSKAASIRVKTAQRMHTYFPALVAALRDGRVNWNHVAVFDKAANHRIRNEMVELLEPIIELAQVTTFERWSAEVRGIAERLDQDGGFDPSKDPASNWLKLTPTYDGAVDISGRLVGELAFKISKLIEAETDKVAARHRADAEQIEACELPDDLVGSQFERVPPSHAQCAAEALGEIVDRAFATPEGQGNMPHPDLIVTLNSETGELRTDSGEMLPLSMMRWLVASAFVRPLEMSDTGDPLRMGRLLRFANREQRRAMILRDGGCVFPGCNRPPSMCDAHHVDEWDDNGPTDIENMALLCRHHHRVTHQPGWHMRSVRGPKGEVLFEWTTPTGRILKSQRHQTATAATGPPLARKPAARKPKPAARQL